MTWLPTGAFVRRTENLVAHEGPIYWSPETADRSEGERLPSEELGSGAGLTVVESLFSSEVVAIEGRKGKFTSIAGWKHLLEKMARLLG